MLVPSASLALPISDSLQPRGKYMATYEVIVLASTAINLVASNQGDVHEKILDYIDNLPNFDKDDRNWWGIDDIEIIQVS